MTNGNGNDEGVAMPGVPDASDDIQARPGGLRGLGEPSELQAPERGFQFQNAGEGPLGRNAAVRDPERGRDLWPQIPPSPAYRVITATGAGPVRYVFHRPVLLNARIFRFDLPGTLEQLYLQALPDRAPESGIPSLLQRSGIPGPRGLLYIPTPGVWYISAITLITQVVRLLEIDATNPSLARSFEEEIDFQCFNTTGAPNAVPVGAGVDQIILTLAEVLGCRSVEVINTGANAITLRWGNPASASFGRPLQPGESVRWSGAEIPSSALHAFGSGGASTVWVG